MLSFWQLLQLLLATLPAAAINLTGYEYIVVGSGAGGGPLAARLALAGHSTLLLEAGTDQAHNLNTSVPAYAALAAADDHLSWNFFIRHYADDAQQARDPKTVYTTPTGEQYVGLHPPPGSIMKGILYTRASTLGGCTAHNALVAIYPHRSDWTYIANLTNDSSWLPDLMREYYIRLENNHYLPPNIPGHGYTGWLSTEHAPINLVFQDPQLLSLLLGAVFTQPRTILSNLISLLLGDVNSPSPSRDSKPAYYQTPIATSSNVRNGVADFLRIVHSATNPDGSQKYPLTIRTNCHVTRVLFDTTSHPPQATGVSFLDGPYLYRASPLSSPNTPRTPGTATATREIILSAGVFNTPQILQLSGIGPADLLKQHNIPVLVNLPGVGANLQDHYETSVVVEAPFPFRILNGCTFNYTSDPCLIRWLNPKGLHKDRGIYSSAGFTSTLLHHTPFPNTSTTPNSNKDNNNDDYNTIIYGGLVNFRGYFPGFEVNLTLTHHSFTWAIIQAHPSNRAGTVNISSSDPLDPPHILFNSFSDPDSEKDLFALVDAIRVARKALKRQLIPTWETLPGKEVQGYEELRQYVLDTSWGHHAVGTCRIGRGEGGDDEGAVVDGKFRVRGVRGLRVVDASVFPRAQGTFPVLGVYMLAEKAVGDILGDGGG